MHPILGAKRARRPSQRSGTGRHAAPTRGARAADWLGKGERVPVLATFGLALLLAAMGFRPAQSFLAAADRVEQLADRRVALQTQVDELDDRRRRLQNPDEIELLAREQFGLVEPGEIPYVVVRPDAPADDLEIALPDPGARPWYRRALETLSARA